MGLLSGILGHVARVPQPQPGDAAPARAQPPEPAAPRATRAPAPTAGRISIANLLGAEAPAPRDIFDDPAAAAEYARGIL